MEFTFLLPLSIGLVIGYRAWGSNHDIAHLAIIFAVINLLASLFLAPWEVQIILLVLIAVIARLLWKRFEDQNGFEKSENSQNKDAELHYRGISYESQKSSESVNTSEKITKCYRGVDYERSAASTEKINGAPDNAIKYRGVNLKGK